MKGYAKPLVSIAVVTLLHKLEYDALAPVFRKNSTVSDLDKEIGKHHKGCGNICLE